MVLYLAFIKKGVMVFHLCIQLLADNVPPRVTEGENSILHVKFHGGGRDDYRVEYEKLESTLLTEYLKQRDGPAFHQKIMKLTFNITPVDEANKKCKSVLERGIFCQRPYFFLGHSDDQLKEKSCYLMKATHEEIHELLSQFGNFLEEKNVGKRARKIAMLFSKLNKTMPLAANEYKVEPDIERGVFRSYTFTDGCGFMSLEFSSQVQQILELDYQPSAVHVRYRGIEGMLVLKEDLTEVKVQFHKSMQRFFTPNENMLDTLNFVDVVDYSRPYGNGYLDTRMVMLLADRRVPAKNLEALQDGYHELLEGICKETAEYFLRFKGDFGLQQEIQSKGIDGRTKTRLKVLRKEEMNEMKKAAYTRILVPKSRVVFAVCDPLHKLKYGECYFNPTLPDDEASFPAGQKFVVMRSPCYHPGDVRVLKLTDEKEGYGSLRDCLVLPVKGPRPHAVECSGGDLSGNKFFVCWNEDLIPNEIEKPCNYPPKEATGIRKVMANVASCLKFQTSPRRINERGQQQMRHYFATYTDDLTEKIEKTYMKYAAAFGPSSKECRQLCKMYFQAVNLTEDRVDLEEK